MLPNAHAHAVLYVHMSSNLIQAACVQLHAFELLPRLATDTRLLIFLQRGLPEGDARWLFQQIALAVDFCHRLGIALRDIKV